MPSGAGEPISSMPGLQQLARLPALRAHAAVAVGEVAEAQRRLARGVARGHHARDRHGHVRAQHEHGAGLVEDAVSRLASAMSARASTDSYSSAGV